MKDSLMDLVCSLEMMAWNMRVNSQEAILLDMVRFTIEMPLIE